MGSPHRRPKRATPRRRVRGPAKTTDNAIISTYVRTRSAPPRIMRPPARPLSSTSNSATEVSPRVLGDTQGQIRSVHARRNLDPTATGAYSDSLACVASTRL
jgi:hypothetical protein